MSFLTEVHHRHASIPVVDVLLEPQTIYSFINFCAFGEFPNGTITDQVRPAWDEVLLMTRPFDEWALTVSHDTESESVADQIIIKLASDQDCCRLEGASQHVQAMKSTLWDDLVPISDTQWLAKGLDKHENFDMGLQYLTAVIAGFEYLNLPGPNSILKETFNFVSAELEGFGYALNELRLEEGEDETPVDMASLWGEFIHAHYQLITNRAHSWVMSHVQDMRESIIHDLRAHVPLGESKINPEQSKLVEKMRMLAETALLADSAILLSMKGYAGDYLPSTQGDARLQNMDHATRLDGLRRQARSINLRKINRGFFQPMDQLIRDLRTQIETEDEIRKKLRSEPMALPPRRWIMRLLMDIKRAAGDDYSEPFVPPKLAVYRATYKQTDQEWAEFLRRLEADMASWGDGVEGASEIKDKLELHWFDGKEIGVEDGDLDMVKKHFSDMANGINDDALVLNIMADKFLAIDDASFSSYTTDDYSLPSNSTGLFAADFKPFVLTIDSRYDPNEPYVCADEAPGYKGEMRILGSLVWTDLYARLVDMSPSPLWPYAMEHPNQVYTGPTVPLQVEAWRKYNAGRKLAGDAITEQQRKPDHNEL